MRKRLLIGSVGLLLATLLQACSAGVLFRYAIRPSLPQLSTTITVPASETIRDGTVEIAYTDSGHPSVFAGTVTEMYFGQGYSLGRDRSFQLDILRKTGYGRLTEIAGSAMLSMDRLFRRLGIGHISQQVVAAMPTTTYTVLQAYADGVNAAISNESPALEHRITYTEFAPWTVTDCVAVSYTFSWFFSADLEDEVIGSQLLSALGPAGFTLFPTGLDREFNKTDKPWRVQNWLHDAIQIAQAFMVEGGSNNWAIATSATTSTAPIIAGDPHITGNVVPGLFYPISLFANGISAVGLAIPGIPGLALGRNQYLGWTLTNNYADIQDLIVEDLDDDGNYWTGTTYAQFESSEQKYYLGNGRKAGEWFTETVRRTVRGPVISDALDGITEVTSLQWAPAVYVADDLPLPHLLSATDAVHLQQMGSQWGGSPFNVVYATVDDDIGHFVIGPVPERSGPPLPIAIRASTMITDSHWGDSLPTDQLPQLSPTHWVGTANHNVVPPGFPYYYSSRFSPRYRYDRMKEYLDPITATHSVATSIALQLDTQSTFARRLTAAVIPMLLTSTDKAIVSFAQQLQTFDGNIGADSYEALWLNRLWYFWLISVVEDDIPDPLLNKLIDWPNFYHERALANLESGRWILADNRTTPSRETIEQTVIQAAQRTIQNLNDNYGGLRGTTWGEFHTITLRHTLFTDGLLGKMLGSKQRAMPGDTNTVMRAGADPLQPQEANLLAGARFVADLADSCVVHGQQTSGRSGRWRDAHYLNQFDTYLSSTYDQWPACRELAQQKTRNKTTIQIGPQLQKMQ